jgi:hypothetical protein
MDTGSVKEARDSKSSFLGIVGGTQMGDGEG